MRPAKIKVLSFELRCARCGLELSAVDDEKPDEDKDLVFSAASWPQTVSLTCLSCGLENLVPHEKINKLFAKS